VVTGKIAYCSQEPWIITGTIRQNILCGAQMDPERYQQVIRVTALEQDLYKLPQGDYSIIGEGGISLSGGQKARVNLARCLYVDADIYLLDDPLSAVDTHVGAHLVQRAIKRFLRDKIRILVTHQLQHIKNMDHMILLKSVGHRNI
jgi:ATP-binding cassette subfamily C (CFTR/MRP) protein 4